MLVSKNAKICNTPNANAKICVTPNRKTRNFALPNASRWNIGCIGSPTQGAGVGNVDFILFVSFLVALGTQRKRNIQWNTGFRSFNAYIFISVFI